MLAEADEIELVDMSPHALRQRMRHGNVYPPERTAIALDRFFTEANLTALRELSLRTVARRVEDELEDVAAGQPTHRGALAPRVAVLIDGAPATGLAVRRAADLAAILHGEFLAIVPDLAAVPGARPSPGAHDPGGGRGRRRPRRHRSCGSTTPTWPPA